jgi:hypothetical protein
MLNKMHTAGIAALVALAPMAASAVPVVVWDTTPVPAANNPAASATVGTVREDLAGSLTNVYLSPYGDDTTLYTSVDANSAATYILGGIRSVLNLVWGSPDNYNYIDFYRGGLLVDTLQGVGNGSNRPDAYASISGISGGTFDTVVLRSVGSNAFEFGALSAVPLPAGGLLLLGALGGLGALRRRKKAA